MEPLDLEPMRPVDHVEAPLPESRFVFTSRGWRGQILPVLFGLLIVVSAVVGASGVAPWWTWWVQGTFIAVVMLIVNLLLRRWMVRKV
ncbi:hypothetical protein ACQ7HM_05025 [Williamsia sp. MIQD14]|uniref:hypothetical protein n=1 Tax=Williamsia sp. MIQD14 TaxID=3425703 RepID=UPI003DA0CA8B